MPYYQGQKFFVRTINRELLPLNVYEVERGEFSTYAAAETLANELAEAGEFVEIERRQWVEDVTGRSYRRPKAK